MREGVKLLFFWFLARFRLLRVFLSRCFLLQFLVPLSRLLVFSFSRFLDLGIFLSPSRTYSYRPSLVA